MCAARGRFLHELEKCQKDCLGPPKGSEDAAWLRTSLLPGMMEGVGPQRPSPRPSLLSLGVGMTRHEPRGVQGQVCCPKGDGGPHRGERPLISEGVGKRTRPSLGAPPALAEADPYQLGAGGSGHPPLPPSLLPRSRLLSSGLG